MNEEQLYEKAQEMKDKDFMQTATAFDGTIRIFVTRTTDVVKKAQELHKMYPTCVAALGRTMTATLMMGAMLKGDQTIAVKIEGDGPIGKIVCEADASGKVMGYLHNGEVYLKYSSGKLNVGDAVGRTGLLTVVKDLHLKEPFVSSVPLVSGEIAEDFTYYFVESEQVPSSVSLGVLVGVNGDVLAAGGFIVQVMPGCKEETIKFLEEQLPKVRPVSDMIKDGLNGRGILKEILLDNSFNILSNRMVKFQCKCSKEKYRAGIKSLGYKTVKQLVDEDHGATATCQFCHQTYDFTEEELKEILSELN